VTSDIKVGKPSLSPKGYSQKISLMN